MLTEEWLAGWAARLREAAARLPAESEWEIGPPVAPDGIPDWLPTDLVALLRVVGPVSLPDVGNGWFLHPADAAQDDRIADPFEAAVVVFGSDGGGDLFAVTTGDGRVLRLRDAAYLGGVYEGSGITVVAGDLAGFLDLVLRAVESEI